MAELSVCTLVASFFEAKGLKCAFVVSGGASLHLIHALKKTNTIDLVCCHHEQSAAMSADAYTRVQNKPGLAITSSGPGATNLITGICGCYYDSIPAFFITGQVSTFRMSTSKEVRQLGFQETPIVDMVASVTNYAAQITNANDILYELEKAYFLANYARKGPVLIDIPDNIQRTLVNPDSLRRFTPPPPANNSSDPCQSDSFIDCLVSAKRPIVVAGSGIHLSGCEKRFVELIEKLNVPVALTWAAADILTDTSSLRVGTFGTHGSRYANFAVQNADFILSIGSRLDTKATGTPASTFARGAVKAMVDISAAEISKFEQLGVDISFPFCMDAGLFIDYLRKECPRLETDDWIKTINTWKLKYSLSNEVHDRGCFVDPYRLFKRLPFHASGSSHFWCDTGSAIAWMMQAFIPRESQRIWHDYNNTAMGWALPASIGGTMALPAQQHYCIVGDGSFMMNIQELQTACHYGLGIKIICIDNNGYSMIKQTQDQWLNSYYLASGSEGGVSMPNFEKVLGAFGFNVNSCSSNDDIDRSLEWLSTSHGPSFLNVKVDQCCRVVPQVKFGRPNEDPEPLLSRDIFSQEMLIDTL